MEGLMIAKKLNRLRLSGVAQSLEYRLEQASKEQWSYSMFMETLLTDEIERRDNKQFKLRLSKSRLDLNKTLETFDLGFNPKIQISLIRELSLCQFIEKRENIFILGPSGVGKSHLAQAIGHQACRNGIDVMFYCAYDLFEWIQNGKGDGTHKRRLNQIIKTPLLIVDDFGLQKLNGAQQEDLYQVIAQRYEKSSTIITSNRDFDEWLNIFENPLLGTAALDRLIHKGIQIIIEGNSYRLAEFKKTCAKQKKE
ncbi:MAG: IS21-like element helper ATPase IstB [Alphaproteobacteria bacterium]|nr:IS21-like element helper ATPase IstB [Alphaproteobacteria bacterium]